MSYQYRFFLHSLNADVRFRIPKPQPMIKSTIINNVSKPTAQTFKTIQPVLKIIDNQLSRLYANVNGSQQDDATIASINELLHLKKLILNYITEDTTNFIRSLNHVFNYQLPA
jgi:hypothetical protein